MTSVMKVKKEKIKVSIYLINIRIIGYIHIMPHGRLTDNLNANTNKDFIPITEAEVHTYYPDEKIEYVDAIEVNKAMIQAITPLNN